MCKYRILFVSIIIIASVLYLTNILVKKVPIEKSNTVDHNKIKDINTPTINKNTKVQVKELEKTSNFYSNDTIINRAIINTLYEVCIDYFKGVDSMSIHNKSKKLQAQLDVFTNNCEVVNKEHPEFLLENWDLSREHNSSNPHNSVFSKYVKSSYPKIKLNDNFDEGIKIIKQLKYENPNILLIRHLQYELYDFYIEYLILEMYSLLQTQNESYLLNILLYSEVQLACKLGAECGKNSFQLLIKCYNNNNFCGLNNYQELIELLTPSQQYDIELLVKYLEDLFEI